MKKNIQENKKDITIPIDEDKELEDAAYSYTSKQHSPLIGWGYGEDAFKAGAAWRQEQSEDIIAHYKQEYNQALVNLGEVIEQSDNDAENMLDWINDQGWCPNPPIWTNGEISSDCDNGKGTYTEITSKQLYELWKNRNK